MKNIKKIVRDKLVNLIRDSLKNGDSEKIDRINQELEHLSRNLDKTSASLLDLNQTVRNLNQTVNLISKKIKKDNNFICAFIIHNVEAWDSIGSVIAEFSQDSRFTPIIFSVNRRFPGEKSFIDEDKVHKFLSSQNIDHIRLNNKNSYLDLDIIKTLSPDIIFRQSQWDYDYPPGFATENLRFAKLYYIPYEIMNFLDGVDENINNSYFHQSCELVFSANSYSKEQDEKLSTLKNHIVTGHPKVEVFQNAKPSWPIAESDNYKVIWGAHHSIFDGWSNFGMFLSIYKEMLVFAKNNQDIDIIFSPHPALVTIMNNIEDEGLRSDFDNFITEWNALSNTGYSIFSTYSSIFKAADLLLIDGISWLLEFQLEKKPIIFLERKNHLPFDGNGIKISEGLNAVNDIHQALNMLIEFKDGKADTKKSNQERNCEDFLIINKNDSVAKKIVSAVYDNILLGR